MNKINKLNILKVLGLGIVLTTPLLFMTSCSSTEVGTSKKASVLVNGKNLEEYKEATTASAAISEVAQFCASTIPLNFNHADPSTQNALLATPSAIANNFNFFWTTEFISGSGPFIDTSKVLGLTLESINVNASNMDAFNTKPASGATAALSVSSVSMKFIWWNKYEAKVVSGDDVKNNLNYWKEQGNFLPEAQTYIDSVQQSYTINFNINATYNLKEAEEKWSINDAQWSFPGATGKEISGKTFVRNADTHEIIDLINKFVNYNKDSQKPKYNVDKAFYESIKDGYAGLINSIA